MAPSTPEIIVAGHICLDLIPTFRESSEELESLFIPGKLTEVGPVVISTGGAVSNTGIALHRLGIPTTLVGKIGDDLFGKAVLEVLRENAEILAKGMVVEEEASTSYTLVLNPPGVDRMFLHNPGTNDTFVAADVDAELCRQVKIFHFGYPSLMRNMYENTGAEFVRLMRFVKETGVTTSLDMSYPDPESDAGRADWPRILREALPSVDIFLPSLDEIMFMLRHPQYESLDSTTAVSIELLQNVSGRLLDLGVAVVGLKLGEQGLYIRTTPDSQRLREAGPALHGQVSGWTGRELYAPALQAKVAGTTGAGDSAIAGFLAGILRGLSIDDASVAAVAAGAFNVESPDATSGIPEWETMQQRIRSGWKQHEPGIRPPEWETHPETGIWERKS